jgi:catechol 2,3-dioxygenase-like lactoylglutathione lyase family enzyme
MSVLQLRVALTTDDWDRTAAFYRDGLGLEPGELWTDLGRGQMFYAGKATLEVFDPGHAAGVDELEVGERVSGPVRLAFEVADVHAALERALAHGGTLVRAPTLTPWNDLNARVLSPDGMQVTLFQVMGEKVEPPA